MNDDNGIVWEPTSKHLTSSNVAAFLDKYNFEDYDELQPQSEAEIAEVWRAIVDDLDVEWLEHFEEVLETSEGVEFAKWFTGGRLNIVDSAVDRWAERTPDAPVYHWTNEAGEAATITYGELKKRIDHTAGALREHGVERGDRIAIIYPFKPEAFILAFAAMRIGAIFVPIFPGYGRTAITQRIDDSGASLVFTADGYRRDGTIIELADKVSQAIEGTSVERLIVEDYVGVSVDDIAVASTSLATFIEGARPVTTSAEMASEDPVMYAYSSGTTGRPKGTIHTHASLLVMGTKEARYHFDLSQGDTLLWTTDFGWVIVPVWMMSGAPVVGAATVLLEGAFMTPDPNRVWRSIDRFDVTTFGTSPTGARGFREANQTPREDHNLESLRVLASTGEPWDEDTWRWFFEAVGDGRCPIINASGGTEFCGAILSPTPMSPLKPGTLYGPAPGVPAAVYDKDGEETDEGFLVVEGPVPGMTRSLTGGDDRYIEEYWQDFDGVWNQNDWVTIDDDNFWYIVGRADDTMNVAGRRISATEVESTIIDNENVTEAVVVPVPDERRGEVPVAFITVEESLSPVDESAMKSTIEDTVKNQLGAPFRPADIHVVSTIPRTQTEKVPRKVIRSTYLGDPPEDVSTLEGGEALYEYPAESENVG